MVQGPSLEASNDGNIASKHANIASGDANRSKNYSGLINKAFRKYYRYNLKIEGLPNYQKFTNPPLIITNNVLQTLQKTYQLV